jgi:hypothetical protein
MYCRGSLRVVSENKYGVLDLEVHGDCTVQGRVYKVTGKRGSYTVQATGKITQVYASSSASTLCPLVYIHLCLGVRHCHQLAPTQAWTLRCLWRQGKSREAETGQQSGTWWWDG